MLQLICQKHRLRLSLKASICIEPTCLTATQSFAAATLAEVLFRVEFFIGRKQSVEVLLELIFEIAVLFLATQLAD